MKFDIEDRPALAAKAGVVVLAVFVAVAVGYRHGGRKEPAAPVRASKPVAQAPVPQVGKTRQAAPPPVPVAQEALGRALSDTAIRNLIQDYRVASYRGDNITARATMQALKRRPREAVEVLRGEISRTRDQSLAGFYKVTLEELGQ